MNYPSLVLRPLFQVDAEKIIKEINTKGSAPLLILANDGNNYFSKTTTHNLPRVELINELLCAYFLQCWLLKIPNFALINIDIQVVKHFEEETAKLSPRYTGPSFKDNLFYGSNQIQPAIEFEEYFTKFNSKSEYNHFQNPLDLIKIGVFDVWIGNKDRKPGNPNILIGGTSSHFDFHPIDHAAAFAYCTNYKSVSDSILFMENKFRILMHPIVPSIANFATRNAVLALQEDILEGMERTIVNIDFIFEQVPKAWGFSNKEKEHLKNFLSNRDRNTRIAAEYLTYLK